MELLKECNKVAIIGCAGQIGTDLVRELRKRYGNDKIIAIGHRSKLTKDIEDSGPFFYMDIRKYEELKKMCVEEGVDVIINMAALLSSSGEKYPELCWDVNVNGWLNCLNIGKELKMKQVFGPSSIAAFGPDTPKKAPNDTILRPTTMYGITKVSGELLGNYYRDRFGLDVRGIRYPGIISDVLPTGGTTDYSVEIYYSAVKYKKYCCYLSPNTRIPMMHIKDCIKCTIDLINADSSKLKHFSDFNVSAISFTPDEQCESIKKIIPEFEITYDVDEEGRQKIADSWPDEVDDTCAREEWGWKPSVNLDKMTVEMINILREKFEKGELDYTNPLFEK